MDWFLWGVGTTAFFLSEWLRKKQIDFTIF